MYIEMLVWIYVLRSEISKGGLKVGLSLVAMF